MKKALIGVFTLFSSLGFAASAQAATMFEAIVNGSNIPTPVDTDASAFGSFTLNDDQTELEYDITFNGLELFDPDASPDSTGTLTRIHLHATDVPGFHVINIWDYDNPSMNMSDDAQFAFESASDPIRVTGIWDDGDSTCPLDNPSDPCYSDPATSKPLSDYVDELLNGDVYVNIHTTDFPSGEIRGSLLAVEDLPPGEQIPATPEPGTLLGLMALSGLAGASLRKKSKQ